MLAPNKQNLLLLKKQKKSVQSGHRLLKEKRNGLILIFIDLARKGKQLESEVQLLIQEAIAQYDVVTTIVSVEDILLHISKINAMKLSITKKRMSGVLIENLDAQVFPPRQSQLKEAVGKSLALFSSQFPKLIEVTQLKLTVQKLSYEIQKVNRQISNLENQMEDIDKNIKFIAQALQEKQNQEKALLIKLFT